MRRLLLLTVLASLMAAGWADFASAGGRSPGARRSQTRIRSNGTPITNWHQSYYHAASGMPLALVVPPTAELQTKWGWGVGGTEVVPIWPQFGRNYPGPNRYDPRLLRPTPSWPSHTDQFGVYYVRGPW